jgi:hypothetical protein
MEKAMVEGTPRELRDRRDWSRIRDWSHQIARALAAAPV